MKSAMLKKQHREARSFVAFPDVEKGTSPSPSPHKYLNPIVFMCVLAIVLTIPLIYIRQFANQSSDFSSATATPTPTPIILMPDEGVKGNYAVSQPGKITGPRITKVTFDPLDVKLGQPITISAKVFSLVPVSKVSGNLQQDLNSTPLTFTQTATEPDTGNTVWTATTTLSDTVLYRYILDISATDSNGTSTIQIAPRS